jgi:hypothetical protein
MVEIVGKLNDFEDAPTFRAEGGIITTGRYPWDAVELDYRAGFLPDAGIAHKYGMSVGRLQSVARARGWTRKPITADDIHGAAEMGPIDVGAEPISPAEVRLVQRLQIGAVVKSHRTMIARARGQTEELLERLGAAMIGQPKTAVVDPDGEPVVLPFKADRESPAELLDKLTKVMVRLVGLERQTYGLDVMQEPQFDESGNKAEAQDRISGVMDRLDQMARDKRLGAGKATD